MICVGCGEPIFDGEELIADGTRHVGCICTCHDRSCPKKCFLEKCDQEHPVKEPCRGECGCSYCHQAYQDFLSEDYD